ncbi:MAG: endo-alpha-N-acetylgalactosaminidase family protein [Actinomycetaceae bacterium]|nr:endo-alpha-N-acetylgalactosaminidase family protein [Actinomycetaceae bacterium]
MSRKIRKIRMVAGLVGSISLVTMSLLALPAHGSEGALPQSQMKVIEADSVEKTGEGTNGAPELVLDGNKDTYWHTKWAGGVDKAPHHITVQVADGPVKLGKIVLTPRQSSNGSGRAHSYEVQASPTCAEGSFTTVKTGEFPGDTATSAQDREIIFEGGVDAKCLKVTYLSSWGGKKGEDPVSPPEQVASLAEFNAYPYRETTPTPAAPTPSASNPFTDKDSFWLREGNLWVQMRRDFPQVIEWKLGSKKQVGNYNKQLPELLINEKPVTAKATLVNATATKAIWNISVPNQKVQFIATASVSGGNWRLELSGLTDPGQVVNRIKFRGFDLVTLSANQPGAHLSSAIKSTDRTKSGDRFEAVKDLRGDRNGWFMIPSTNELAFGMESSAVEDGTVKYDRGRQLYDSRWVAKVANSRAAINPGTLVWKGGTATKIGLDANPFIQIRPTADANKDGKVDWQDGAIALREIRAKSNGADDVKNKVITRIPFNIVSQATHPFLRVLDETKRIALATDNLGQQVMLKGYQSEGHDAAHPDYAGHYNERAGGLKDITTLANKGKQWNANFGVHVNVTESYSESHNFSEDLLIWPPQAAWGWMNQAYYIDSAKDLGSGKVLQRFAQLRKEAPANLDWLYIDVYYDDGWEADRLGKELQKQGWKVGSEWAYSLPEVSLWSHWANEERYGGQQNKGLNSKILRFMENSRRDTFNPDPILSNTNLVEFEGWTGHNNYHGFIRNVWERNFPTKFLQQSDIMSWEDGQITFANGTVATSPLQRISGTEIPTNRTIKYDGATVYEQGKYLLPWRNGGTDRLYHWNPAGGKSTWHLTNAWAGQSSLALFKLTDSGRQKVADLPVTNGQVTIPAEAGMAYVLYPAGAVPPAKAPHWGEASGINDPGFYSGTLDSYQTKGSVSVKANDRGNRQAVIGAGAASLQQTLHLPAGTYNASAMVEIKPTAPRQVSLSVRGVGITPAGLQPTEGAFPTTTFTSTGAPNSTASDELLGTYFQRARVTFTTTGGDVNFQVKVGAGENEVRIDDLRVTNYVPAVAPSGAKSPIVFENFENPDVGYWPFVTGSANQGGDGRTQLAERHEPYSQRGWWGKNAQGQVVEGGKLIDNVLDGRWSLMAHEENEGLILRTTTANVPFKAGHKYRVSFDYQAGYDGGYYYVHGCDRVKGELSTQVTESAALKKTSGTTKFQVELDAGACGQNWVGIVKKGGGSQNDLSIDNFMVEDLGKSEQAPGLASKPDPAPETAPNPGPAPQPDPAPQPSPIPGGDGGSKTLPGTKPAPVIPAEKARQHGGKHVLVHTGTKTLTVGIIGACIVGAGITITMIRRKKY